MSHRVNPPLNQDRARDLLEHWEKYGEVMFRQQRAIYQGLAAAVRGKSVIEAGCGSGLGSAVLERAAASLVATDVLPVNLSFAAALYPWLDLRLWDLNQPCPYGSADVAVAVEAFEHVANPGRAAANLVNAARKEVWVSTPNGDGKVRPPANPHHVCEYTVDEVLGFFFDCTRVSFVNVHDWGKLGKPDPWTATRTTRDAPRKFSDPLVYQVVLK
jgi:2-polyprenyl-3-methyl-5-hydroxy-6-metoxy-1,4-benzoquinol methylase